MDDLIDRLLDKFCRIVGYRKVDAGRKTLLRLGHHRFDAGRGGERVRARPLEDQQRGRRIAVQIGIDRVVLRAEFHAGDVADSRIAVCARPDDDAAELLWILQAPKRLHRKLERTK